jgi:hypothetical protein
MTDEELGKLYKEFYNESHEAALRAVFNAGWKCQGVTLVDVVDEPKDA